MTDKPTTIDTADLILDCLQGNDERRYHWNAMTPAEQDAIEHDIREILADDAAVNAPENITPLVDEIEQILLKTIDNTSAGDSDRGQDQMMDALSAEHGSLEEPEPTILQEAAKPTVSDFLRRQHEEQLLATKTALLKRITGDFTADYVAAMANIYRVLCETDKMEAQ